MDEFMEKPREVFRVGRCFFDEWNYFNIEVTECYQYSFRLSNYGKKEKTFKSWDEHLSEKVWYKDQDKLDLANLFYKVSFLDLQNKDDLPLEVLDYEKNKKNN